MLGGYNIWDSLLRIGARVRSILRPNVEGTWERFGDTGVVSLWSSGPLRIQELCLLKVSDLQGLDGVG